MFWQTNFHLLLCDNNNKLLKLCSESSQKISIFYSVVLLHSFCNKTDCISFLCLTVLENALSLWNFRYWLLSDALYRHLQELNILWKYIHKVPEYTLKGYWKKTSSNSPNWYGISALIFQYFKNLCNSAAGNTKIMEFWLLQHRILHLLPCLQEQHSSSLMMWKSSTHWISQQLNL